MAKPFSGPMTWGQWIKSVPGELRPPHIQEVRTTTWSDPEFRKQRPWTAILNYVVSVLTSIGEPFVCAAAVPSNTVTHWAVWRHQEPSRYPTLTRSPQEKTTCREERGDLLSQPAFRKLPSEVQEWMCDVQDKSSHVAWLLADVEGCMAYLKKQIEARQALIQALTRIGTPALSDELKRGVTDDSQQALAQLDKALRTAEAAKRMLEPCTEYFLNKKSPTRKRDRDRLVGLLIQHGGVTRNRASTLVAKLLPTLNPHFTEKPGSVRVSVYPPSMPSHAS